MQHAPAPACDGPPLSMTFLSKTYPQFGLLFGILFKANTSPKYQDTFAFFMTVWFGHNLILHLTSLFIRSTVHISGNCNTWSNICNGILAKMTYFVTWTTFIRIKHCKHILKHREKNLELDFFIPQVLAQTTIGQKVTPSNLGLAHPSNPAESGLALIAGNISISRQQSLLLSGCSQLVFLTATGA